MIPSKKEQVSRRKGKVGIASSSSFLLMTRFLMSYLSYLLVARKTQQWASSDRFRFIFLPLHPLFSPFSLTYISAKQNIFQKGVGSGKLSSENIHAKFGTIYKRKRERELKSRSRYTLLQAS